MSQALPAVQDDVLVMANAPDSARALTVGTADWFGWLGTAHGFRFSAPEGHFIARKQQRSGHWYWYAYGRRDGRLRSAYLGKSSDLTPERLTASVRKLAGEGSIAALCGRERAARRGRPTGQTGRAPRASLMMTKLVAPSVELQRLVRTQASHRWQEVLERPLTFVSAPAGYGKTTLAAQWIALSGAHAAWVSLDEGDNDPTRLWIQVLAALERLAPGMFRRLSPLLDAPDPLPIAALASLLACELVTLPSPTIIVLDNCEALHDRNMGIHASLARLVEELPAHVHVVLVGRTPPPLPLARLRVEGRAAGFRAADLRLTAEETQLLFAESRLSGLTAQDAAILCDALEGWVGGLKLAEMSCKGRDDPHAKVASFRGSHHFVVEYVAEQVLAHVPDGVRAFLIETSVVERLSASLCDAMTGMRASNQMLDQAEQANLFVEPQGDHGMGYRLHTPYREALQALLRARSPGRVPALCLRASVWYEAHGQIGEAIEYAFQAGGARRAARLIDAAADAVLRDGRPERLLAWIARQPETLVRQRPGLCVAHAEAALYAAGDDAADLDVCMRRMRDAREALAGAAHDLDAAARDCIRSGMLAVRAVVAATAMDATRSRALFSRVLRALPASHRMHWYILNRVGHAAISSGDLEPADRAFSELARHGEAENEAYFLYLGLVGLARVAALEGRLRAALRLCGRIREHARLSALDATFGRAAAIADAVHHERNDARNDARNDHSAAAEHLDALEQSAARFDAERECIATAWNHLAGGGIREALALVDQVLPDAEAGARLPHVLRLLVLQALAYDALGDAACALRPLARAVALAEPERFIRVFLEAGQATERLLTRLHTQQVRPGHADVPALTLRQRRFLETVLATFGLPGVATAADAAANASEAASATSSVAGAPSLAPAAQPLVESLSQRELEVLRLLAGGAANADIATELVIAVGTVKGHVSNILDKLGVRRRAQVIERAAELGLIRPGQASGSGWRSL